MQACFNTLDILDHVCQTCRRIQLLLASYTSPGANTLWCRDAVMQDLST